MSDLQRTTEHEDAYVAPGKAGRLVQEAQDGSVGVATDELKGAGAPPQPVDPAPERYAVPVTTHQAGNSASTGPGGGEMGVKPIEGTNRNTNLDRARDERRSQDPSGGGIPVD